MNTLKKCLPDVIVIVAFIVISLAYFLVPVMQGKVLYSGDVKASAGAGKDVTEYREKTGETSRWTNSTFSGMPTYQISPSYNSTDGLSKVMNAYHLWLPDNVWFIFAYLLGFYIMLRAFDFRQSLAALGSIIWAFSSYFIIIIPAGHLWKVMALAYLPPLIGGVVLAYRGKYLWGLVVTAIFTAFEIKANHAQMTYYYFFIIVCMVVAMLVDAIRKGWMPRFLKATGTCLLAAVLGLAINASTLYHTWQYQKESMRGKSELVKKQSSNQTNSGLERSYITQYSYGIDETLTLLIPDAKGSTSAQPLSMNEKAMEKADPEVQQYLPGIYDSIPQYFGESPGTSGPVYVGAFVLFLFFLGLFIVKGPMKWGLLAATILSILLSWGHNFMGFTNFFIDYVPLYSKFRTVESILVIAEFTIPLLAVMALKKIADDPTVFSLKRVPVIISLVLTAGVALFVALFPSVMGPMVTGDETKMLAAIQGMPQDLLQMTTASIAAMREAIVSGDAWRSLLIIAIGVAVLLLYRYKKLKALPMVIILAVLCLVDLWQVDKRYLNDGMFVAKSERDTPVEPSETDLKIMQDKGVDYRVLNFASDTFNENQTSLFHKSIGGYNAAKLRRYQELIETYIAPEMQAVIKGLNASGGDMLSIDGRKLFPVLNMLNTKYFILPLQNNQTLPMTNLFAQGNGWFVDRLVYADNANGELYGMKGLDLSHEATADKKFQQALGSAVKNDSTARVTLVKYAPNNLQYDVNSKNGGVVVFSEIYYPEWTATIDGKPAELGRANYVLRALRVGPGSHKVVLDFHPQSITVTETVAYVASALVLIAIIWLIVRAVKNRKKEEAAK